VRQDILSLKQRISEVQQDGLSPDYVRRLVERPLSGLWDDCQKLVDSHVSKVNEFMSDVREQVVLEAHTLFHNLSADVAVLRDSAALVQKYRRAVCDTSALQEQAATHDSALQQLTEMLGMLVSGNPKVIADAVSRAFQQFVESDVIAGAVRAELLRSPARDDPVHVGLLPSRLRPASSHPSSSF